MGAMKHYFNDVVCACSDQQFGQDAVEYALQMGWVTLSYDLKADVETIMGQYDQIIEAYRREVNRNEEVLADSYAPLLALIELDTLEGQRKDRLLFPRGESVKEAA